jgi:hypothetical protein
MKDIGTMGEWWLQADECGWELAKGVFGRFFAKELNFEGLFWFESFEVVDCGFELLGGRS